MLGPLVIFSLVSLASTAEGKDNRICTQNGTIYEIGDIVSTDGCKLCACSNTETIECINIACQTEREEYDCIYNGKTYKKGEKFTNDCNVCFCINTNKIICTEKSCNLPPIQTYREGDEETCHCNGHVYNIGEHFTHGDSTVCTCEGVNAFICKEVSCSGVRRGRINRVTQLCRKCQCGSTIRSFCENVNRFPSNGTERVTFKDSCYYKGKLYNNKERIRLDCNICMCFGEDHVTCTKRSCGFPNMSANNDNKVVGKDCEYEGQVFPTGKTFTQDCHICYCSISGYLDCLLKWCPPYTRLLRIEDSCEYNGFFFSKGQNFMDDDCQSCKCLGSDNFICRKVSYNSMGHDVAKVPEQLTATCYNDGKVYTITDEITNDTGNVTTLHEKWLLIV